ncbi:signal recognition particle protein [Buchnera aphidicola (Pemphigus obesinymphae)]|uniref:signal recognition particle protein n=1 Tax=Buchnera aphidicola TaxID=9 RepID=UPI002237DC74|nr:signal recognition particle protein [Buchnera aphidicola]MCW5196668.1 signal recognition particle protein [Buchnera aphidicola (Pemphigus obesinymphae)]
MFDHLTKRISETLNKIANKGRLTENNISVTLREVRIALLEADVALPVIKQFIHHVKKKSLGNKINNTLTPGQTFIKIVKKELILIMGEQNNTLNLNVSPPAVLLIVGMQGSGKTTNLVKLAKLLKETKRKKILMVSTDIYRPAAIKQLEVLSSEVNIDVFPSNSNQKPIEIANKALEYAKIKFYDILLIDTAGRLHVEKKMMNEIKEMHDNIKPIETLLVIDAMTGQDSMNILPVFNNIVPISGIILTKMDSDTRGGVALSIRFITGKPVKFIGTGEKLNSIEPFYPDRIASRILGMGDILSLIENVEAYTKKRKSEKLKNKLKNKNKFDLNDFLIHIKQMQNMGGVSNLIEKLPKNQVQLNHIQSFINDKILVKFEAIINSMTKKERKTPEIIKGSQKRRIASGSGVNIQDINKLLKQFNDLKKIMTKIKTWNVKKVISQIKNIIPKNMFN